jgi:glycosyltransferase involved in cell wall biosynthesis
MRKRIVMLGTAYDTMGGISAVVNVYRAAGLFDRWPITYIATHRDGSKFAKLIKACSAVVLFLRLLITGRVAAVHVHTSSGPSFWRKAGLILMAKMFGVRYIYHLHGGFFPEFYKASGTLARWFIRDVFQKAETVIVLSEEWKLWVQSAFSCLHVCVIANSVPIPPVTNRHEVGCLLFLGRLGKNKGIYDILIAIAKLVPEFPSIYLLAGGDGELDQVRDKAKSLGIADRVEILGWVKGAAKEALLARAAIYLLPSYAENLPMSVLEAMAAGLPVISTPVGGIPSAIEDGVEGLLVPPGDTEALTEAIRRLLADSDLRHRMGEAARAKAIAKFSSEKVIAGLEDVYRELGLAPISAGEESGIHRKSVT